MTESEWLLVSDPGKALEAVRATASERKLRYFACACCRRLWHIVGRDCHTLCETTERFADRQANEDELRTAAEEAHDSDWTAALAFEEAASLEDIHSSAGGAAGNAAYAFADAATHYPGFPETDPDFALALRSEKRVQCQYVRDIFGNPFRPTPTLDPAWRRWHDGTVAKLAQRMYDSRDFTAMPVLADALEEAGCSSRDILEHCRRPGPHVRGCWVADLILGKE